LKRETKREQTRERLLEATRSLILEKGCDHLTLNDIMERAGLSKGGIFHHVKSKDELLIRILEERAEETNRRFNAAKEREKSFAAPFRSIADSLPELENPDDAGNRVFVHLLGRISRPEVRGALRQFYEQTLRLSKQWIASGQEAGVIPASVDADKSAELFVLLSLGLRVRGMLLSGAGGNAFDAEDFKRLIERWLQPEP
jgi:AcrR family transcriptional regulator